MNEFVEKHNLSDEQYTTLAQAIQKTVQTYEQDMQEKASTHLWSIADYYLCAGKSLDYIIEESLLVKLLVR